MYEFKFLEAANASINDIIKSKDELLKYIKQQIGVQIDPEIALSRLEKLEKLRSLIEEMGEADENIIEEDLTEEEKMVDEYLNNLSPIDLTTLINNLNIYSYVKNGFNVVIEMDKINEGELDIGPVTNLIQKAKFMKTPLNLYVSGYSQFGKEQEHVDMLFSKEVISVFMGLNSYLANTNEPEIRFLEDPATPYNAWNLDKVIQANLEIDAIVKDIQNKKFSPFETAAYIHHYITSQFPYKDNPEDLLTPRSIVGVLNTDNIVCVGYAKFFKAIVDKLNMPGLSAETIQSCMKVIPFNSDVKMVNKTPLKGFLHLQNLVTIHDEKYNIDGTYFNDSCWDAKKDNFPQGKGFGCFMFPVGDIFNLEGYVFQENESKNTYDGTRMVYSEKITPPSKMKVYKKFNNSKPISLEKYQDCIYTMLSRTYPDFNEKDLSELVNYYMMVSKIISAAVFNDKAKNEFSITGKEFVKSLVSNGNSSEKIEFNEIIK